MKLYELSNAYNQLLESMEDEDDDAVRDTLESISEAFEEKAINICKLIRLKESEIELIDKEVDRLESRKDSLIRSSHWLKKYLISEMERTGKDKIKTPIFNVTVATNPPSVKVVSELDIPKAFMRMKVSEYVDKQAIKEAIEQGEEVPGVELVRNKSLRVR
jgi:hypothetical protein